MKVPFNEDGKIKYKEPLFGRCVKIEIATSRDGSNKALVIEHNPNFTNESTINKAKAELKSGQELALKVVKPGMLCAKIEGTVIELPKANNKNHTPGFTANIKIYNDFGGVITEVLDRRNKYITDFASLSQSTSVVFAKQILDNRLGWVLERKKEGSKIHKNIYRLYKHLVLIQKRR